MTTEAGSPRARSGAARLAVARFVGLAGAVLLAVAAYFGGALPTLGVHVTPLTIWRGPHGPLIIVCWLAGTVLLVGAWWSVREAVPSRRWAYVTLGLWMLPLLLAPPLGSRDVYAYVCQGAVYAAGENPYHMGVRDLPCPWVESVSHIWRDSPAPYGPLFVMVAGAAVDLGASQAGAIALFRVAAVLGVVLAALCLPELARRAGVPANRALWLALACPLVGIHLVSGAHNDAIMIGLLIAGLLVVTRYADRTTGDGARFAGLATGGVLLGLAVAVKATAVVVVPFAALAAMAGPYTWRRLVRDGGPVVAGAVGAVLVTTLVSGLGFGWVAGLARSGDSVQFTSPPTAVGIAAEWVAGQAGLHIEAVRTTRTIGVVLLAVVLVVLWWRARHRDPLLGAGLALAATVAFAPVFHPWYAIWPLAVLAATDRRVRWYALPALAACFLVMADGTGLARFARIQGSLAMTVLVGVLLVWAARRAFARRSRPAVGAAPTTL